jgi:hypothetical protein
MTRSARGCSFPVQPANDSTWTWNDWKVEKDVDTPRGVRHRVTAVALPFRTGSLALPGLAFSGTEGRGAWAIGELPQPHAAGRERPAAGKRTRHPRTQAGVSARVVDDLPVVDRRPRAGALGPQIWLVRRRKPAVRVAAVAKGPAQPAIPAHAEALAALDALARERLPEQGRWIEYQTRLAGIVRRFLERRFGSPQPGYTTRELVLHLVWSGLTGGDVERLKALLRVADLAKFARSEPTVETAKRQETEARNLILAWADGGAEPAGEQSPTLPKAG